MPVEATPAAHSRLPSFINPRPRTQRIGDRPCIRKSNRHLDLPRRVRFDDGNAELLGTVEARNGKENG